MWENGQKFKMVPANKLLRELGTKNPDYWARKGEQMALSLFHAASKRIPAYKDWLKKHKINPKKVRTVADFSKIPPIDKDNYLRAHSLPRLCWNGKYHGLDTISVSSGSSGEPFFWSRNNNQDNETALSHELFLIDSFGIDKSSTLFIVSFSMGVWVAGTLTYNSLRNIASKYKTTVITPGINKDEILKIIQKIGGQYDQIVLAGYPPFVKDVIDEGKTRGINWKKYRIKFLFATEPITERWRENIYRLAGCKNPYKDSLNIYGTADALILAHETPFSIMIKKLATARPELSNELFGNDDRSPTLAQYNPGFRLFEESNGELIFTAPSGIPLLRYRIGDSGGIIDFNSMVAKLKKFNIDLTKQCSKEKIRPWKLPFVYVFGRKDFTATLYGVNIYPENIQNALSNSVISKFITGKFVMITKNDKNQNQYLEINLELKNNINSLKPRITAKIRDRIVKTLTKENGEYKKLSEVIGEKAEPVIKIYPHGYSKLFMTGIKQKWYVKNTGDM